MTNAKFLGIWMDHSSAHLIEFSKGSMETTTIESAFTHEAKEDSLERSEHMMHNKEQHQQKDYYKKLSEVIRNYEEVLLFGPTDAKAEMANFLSADHRFAKIKVETKTADKMSEHEQHALVREYFSKRISQQ
ncbi:MAG: hypothetical protein M3R17_04425 [Bacteroidota bacterium]|nr:hypothetical protein [Bacteroidota bacterium]